MLVNSRSCQRDALRLCCNGRAPSRSLLWHSWYFKPLRKDYDGRHASGNCQPRGVISSNIWKFVLCRKQRSASHERDMAVGRVESRLKIGAHSSNNHKRQGTVLMDLNTGEGEDIYTLHLDGRHTKCVCGNMRQFESEERHAGITISRCKDNAAVAMWWCP
jgi:hypothetical protein